VDDILCTAFEGGITYWCDQIKVVPEKFPEGADYASDCLSRGSKILVHEAEGDEWFELTLNKFLFGLQLTLRKYGMTFENFYENHDAIYADSVVQHSLFLKEVYG
jgi:hypothetical protein